MPPERERHHRSPLFVRLAGPLILISLPILLLSSALRLEMNSVGLYTRGFDNYAVSETTGLTESQLREAAVTLIRYFNHLEHSPQMAVVDVSGRQFDLYHDYEIIHLDDVRGLFDLNSLAQAVSLLLVTILAMAGYASGHRFEVCTALKNGALATLALLAMTSLAFFADFDWMFVAFHLVAFDNPFWQLNPYTDYLVMLFPLGFWQDMALLAGVATGVMAGSIYTLAHVSTRGPRHREPRADTPAAGNRDV